MPGDDFGFKEEPFEVSSSVRFFYYDAARQHIHAHLTSSIRESKGLILLAGERGMGKTILLRHLADKLEAVHGVVLLPPSGVLSCESSPSFGEIIRACRLRSTASCEAADDEDDEGGLAILLERCRKANAPVALILDGADHLPQEVLERLKALSALRADERGCLSIVLSGCLDSPKGLSCSAFEAAQINADVSLRLQRFQDRDVKPYVSHRIQLAGRKGPALFTPAAIDRIIHYSRGNPLSINRICRSALVIASRQTIKTVSAEMVDGVAAGGLRGKTAESPRDSAKGPVQHLDFELPRVPRADETDSRDDRSPPPQSGSDKTTTATEDTGDKFLFRDEPGVDAGGTTEVAALARIPSLRPLEDYAEEDRVRKWPQDRVGIAVRFVWVFLAVGLVSGVTGVYLAQTGRFDAIEFSKRWLALAPGQESTLTQNDPRALGFVGGPPSQWVEPSSKLDRGHPSETETGSFSREARQLAVAQRQSIGKPLQDGGAPVKMGSEAQSEEAFNRTGLSTAPRPLPAPGAAIKKAGPDMEFKPVTETREFGDSPPLAVEAGSAAEADQPAANQAVPAAMETAAGTEETIESGEVGVEAGSAAEADQPAADQAVPAAMETAAATEETIESGEVGVEAGSAAEADQPAADQAVPAAMETAAGTDITVEITDVPANKTRIEDGAEGRSTESAPEAGASDDASVGADRAASDPLLAGKEIRSEAKSPNLEPPNELQQMRSSGVTPQGNRDAEASKRGEGNDTAMAARPDRPFAEIPVSAVKDDRAANLRSAPAADGAQEVTVPVTARVDLPEFRDVPRGRPETQRSEPEVLAPGEPPTAFRVAETTEPQLDVERLLARGDQLLALGDVASARLFYRLAATRGSARGATAMGSSYDPVYLERIGIVGVRPSPADAIKWYRQAIDTGDRAAGARLRELTNRLERAAARGDGEARRILENAGN